MVIIQLLRSALLIGLFSAASVILALLILKSMNQKNFWIYFWTAAGKFSLLIFIIVPLYLIAFYSYDGRYIFEGSGEYLNSQSLLSVFDLKVSGGISNIQKMLSLVRWLFETDLIESHLFSAAIGFAGSIIFIQTMKDFYPLVRGRLLAALWLFYPSIFLFSSLLLKDPFTFFFLSILLCVVLRIERNPRNYWALAGLIFSIGCLSLFRVYTAAIAGGACFVFLISVYYAKLNVRWRLALGGMGFFLTLIVMYRVMPMIYQRTFFTTASVTLDDTFAGLSGVNRNLSEGGSGFDLLRVTGIATMVFIPINMALVFFKPLLWESRNATSFIAAIENLFTIGILFYLVNMRDVFLRVFRQDKSMLFSITYGVLFLTCLSLFAGNSGTLFRQKIMFLPFFFHLLVATLNYKKRTLAEKHLDSVNNASVLTGK